MATNYSATVWPGMVYPAAPASRVTYTPAPPPTRTATFVSPVTTQQRINAFFRIIDLNTSGRAG